MKVLGILGSPRKGGNSDILLEEALKKASSGGAEVEKIRLEGLRIAPCGERDYEEIDERGFSVVHDDMNSVIEKVEECDALILASPIFFGSLSAQTKTLIDRFQCVWLANNVYGKDIFSREKPGAFICVEATERSDFFDNARAIVRHFFATVNLRYTDELMCPGVDSKAKVLEMPEVVEKAAALGKELVSPRG